MSLLDTVCLWLRREMLVVFSWVIIASALLEAFPLWKTSEYIALV